MEGIEPILITATLFTFLIIGFAAAVILTAQKKKDRMRIEMQQMEIENQKQITEKTLESQESERRKLGMELHDDLGPLFGAVKSSLGRIVTNAEQGKPSDKIIEIAQGAESDLSYAMGQFSDLNKLLYPVILDRQGINAALSDLIRKANKTEGVQFNLDAEDLNIQSKTVSTTLFRICQELCTNAMKHSQAKQVSLELKQKGPELFCTYQDDGVGYEVNKKYDGLGLNSIKGRVEAISGKMDIRSSPNEGVNINIVIPNEY